MDPYQELKVGDKYSKKDLSTLLDQPNISLVREGIYNLKNSNSSLFFVDLEKKGKESRFHFDDFLSYIYLLATPLIIRRLLSIAEIKS